MHTVSVRVILDICDTVNSFALSHFSNAENKLCLVYLIGYLCNDNFESAVFFLNYLSLCTDGYLSTACGIGCPDAAFAHYDAACGEIRSLDMLHYIVKCSIRVIDHAVNSINYLS